MTNALIVSSSETTRKRLSSALMQDNFISITAIDSCDGARRCILGSDFDLCVINTPLQDEFGVSLARQISLDYITQVILLVNASIYEEICHKTEDSGVLTLAKPFTHEAFWHTLKLAKAVYNKINKLKSENERLLTTIDDIRIIDRAKYLLIQTLKLTESEAHKYIERQAMNQRITKKAVALNVIKTYQN